MIESWNAIAFAWAEWAWTASIASLVTFALVLLVWLALRRWISVHVGHALFLIPLVPLVLPVGLFSELLPVGTESGLRVAPLSEVLPVAGGTSWAVPVEPSELFEAAPPEHAIGTLPLTSGTEAAPLVVVPRPAPISWLFLAWLVLVLVLAYRFIRVQFDTSRLVRSAKPVDRRRLPVNLRALEREAKLPGWTRVLESESIDSPAVWGWRKPALILPHGLVSSLSAEELRWVLRHELAHLRRRDILVTAAQQVIQILWFFQPVAWLTGRFAMELRECACDEAALHLGTDVPRRRCAEALLRVVEIAAQGARPHLALQTFHAPKALLERRIMRILDTRRSTRSGLTLASIPLLLFTAGGAFGIAGILVDDRVPPVLVSDDEEIEEVEVEDEDEIFEDIEIIDEVDPAKDAAGHIAAIGRGIAWLSATLEKDGGWYAGLDESVPSSGEFNRVGVTGLVVLALIESVKVEGHEVAPKTLADALSFLASVQDPELGAFGNRRDALFMPSHAVATLAWIRAHDGVEDAVWRPVAEKAVEMILRSRNPYRAWRYSSPPDGDNDSFITSLALMALAEARRYGIGVDEASWKDGLRWIEEMTDEKTGRCGYDEKGSPVSRLAAKVDDYPVEYTEMLTAMAITARMRWGEKPIESPVIQQGAMLVATTAPQWDPFRGSIDYYHWLFGTEALKALGGYPWDHWRAFLLRAIVPNQRRDGSWPSIDAWSSEKSTVHATAVVTLTLLLALE